MYTLANIRWTPGKRRCPRELSNVKTFVVGCSLKLILITARRLSYLWNCREIGTAADGYALTGTGTTLLGTDTHGPRTC